MSSRPPRFFYEKGSLCLRTGGKELDLFSFAKDQKRPFYLYDLEEFRVRAQFYKSCFRAQDRVHYAMKANSHPEFLKVAKEQGLGVDLVSGGELKKALEAGFAPNELIFSGVGKSEEDLEVALQDPISQINVESPMELLRIGRMAQRMDRVARVAFRYNPNVNADTHPYIRTGFKENKFGMDESFLPELTEALRAFPDHLKLVGMTLHIGSQLLNVDSSVEAVEKTIPVFNYFKELGQPLESFDVGGGLGIDYESDSYEEEFSRVKVFVERVIPKLDPLNCTIYSEPGRFLVARSGILFTQVEYIKKTPFKNFIIVNTGMHHLLRPSLYKAFHRILPVKESLQSSIVCDVVGPVCESSDVLGFNLSLAEPRQGDWLVILDTGAYGAVMSSDYNSFPRQLEVCIDRS
ncbi:diaminopimelate decarboxylase [bacterium]|nr:diaminopimelate decarboxylase [bacterium]